MTIIDLGYDLKDVKDSFEPLPEGQYMCRIDKCTLTQSSTGKPMLKMEWVVIDGEFEGRRIFDNVVISDQTRWKVKQYADLAGITEGTAVDTNDFEGVEALLGVFQEERNDGKGITNRIKTMTASA